MCICPCFSDRGPFERCVAANAAFRRALDVIASALDERIVVCENNFRLLDAKRQKMNALLKRVELLQKNCRGLVEEIIVLKGRVEPDE